MSRNERIFLSAEWRDLVMLNYEVEPALLQNHIPPGTQLDAFEGKTYVSLVGFRFCRTKLLGFLPVPFHANFDEVNLRFYVNRKEGDEVRRGVVFIAEVVPRWAIAATARALYNENYKSCAMVHRIESSDSAKIAEYQWRVAGRWCKLSAQAQGAPAHPAEGSLEQFITEHYWGYSAQRAGGSLEYHVAHPSWQVWSTITAEFEGDASVLYGTVIGNALQRRPDSAFIADGSRVTVSTGRRMH
jgi:uncharacterized protein